MIYRAGKVISALRYSLPQRENKGEGTGKS